MQQAFLGGWDVGTILNGRSGLPIDVRVTRADVVYRDANGSVVGSPCATCTAVINTPGGGASRDVRRPNLVPGVDPYLKDGLQWLNPAAFSIPAPGEFGDLQRGLLRGPGFFQVDMLVAKRFALTRRAPTSRFAARCSTSSTATTTICRRRRSRTRWAPAPTRSSRISRSRRPIAGSLRKAAQHGRHHRRPGHQPPGAVRPAPEFLAVRGTGGPRPAGPGSSFFSPRSQAVALLTPL